MFDVHSHIAPGTLCATGFHPLENSSPQRNPCTCMNVLLTYTMSVRLVMQANIS